MLYAAHFANSPAYITSSPLKYSLAVAMSVFNTSELAKNEFWLKKIRNVYTVRDLNKDGYISKADFMIMIQRYKDMGCPEEHLDKLSCGYNFLCATLGLPDENAKVTLEESITNFTAPSNSPNVDQIAGLFNLMFEFIDSDENGVISYKEWEDYYRVCGIDTKFAKASFDAMDTNGDGLISKEEFYAYNMEFYFSTEDTLKSSIMYGPLD